VGKGTITFQCGHPQGHDGPCSAIENRPSMSARKRWEDEQAERRHEESGLGQFQGRAQTTAERYTENPTSPPGQESDRDSPAHPPVRGAREAAECSPECGGVGRHTRMPGCVLHDWAMPTKQRHGDQPLPRQTGDTSVQDRIIEKTYLAVEKGLLDEDAAEQIIATLEESKQVGTERYGTPLQTFNGRDTLRDAIEEARDLFVYLSSMEQAREADREHLIEVVAESFDEKARSGFTAREMATVAVDAILKATGGA
jgi:hypothetical protein